MVFRTVERQRRTHRVSRNKLLGATAHQHVRSVRRIWTGRNPANSQPSGRGFDGRVDRHDRRAVAGSGRPIQRCCHLTIDMTTGMTRCGGHGHGGSGPGPTPPRRTPGQGGSEPGGGHSPPRKGIGASLPPSVPGSRRRSVSRPDSRRPCLARAEMLRRAREEGYCDWRRARIPRTLCLVSGFRTLPNLPEGPGNRSRAFLTPLPPAGLRTGPRYASSQTPAMVSR